MLKLVNADKVAEAIAWLEEYDFVIWHDVMECVDKVPTVDAEPVRQGHWIVSDRFAECSCCGMVTTRNELEGISLFGKNEPNYCPNCGAKMDEEEE